jgi:adenosylhomocysteine nucleosidase
VANQALLDSGAVIATLGPRMPYRASELLVVFALCDEAGGRFETLGVPLLYTGVGKVNATYALTKRLTQFRPQLVLAFGTVGSSALPLHALVECTRFVQRDMDVSALGLPAGHTPFDELPDVLEVPRRLALPSVTCASGDQFVTDEARAAGDVVDMEAYALAKVCQREAVAFTAVKYVTDSAGAEAARDWTRNLTAAAHAFIGVYHQLTGHAS